MARSRRCRVGPPHRSLRRPESSYESALCGVGRWQSPMRLQMCCDIHDTSPSIPTASHGFCSLRQPPQSSHRQKTDESGSCGGDLHSEVHSP